MYKWVKRLRRRWHRCRFGRRPADEAVEYFMGRSLTKIGRGAATLPSLPPSPSDFRRNEFAAAVGVRTSVPGTRVRGQFAAEYRRFGPR